MSFRKSSKNAAFTVVYNEISQHSTMSMEARGLIVLMLSLPEDWVYNQSWLQKTARIGRDKMQRILKELTTLGYLIRTPKRSKDKKTLEGYEWEIFAESQTPVEFIPIEPPPSPEDENQTENQTEDPEYQTEDPEYQTEDPEYQTEDSLPTKNATTENPQTRATTGDCQGNGFSGCLKTRQHIKETDKQTAAANAEESARTSTEQSDTEPTRAKSFDAEKALSWIVDALKISHDDDLIHARAAMIDYHSSATRPRLQPALSWIQRALGMKTGTAQRTMRAAAARDNVNRAIVDTLNARADHTRATANNRVGKTDLTVEECQRWANSARAGAGFYDDISFDD